MIPKKLKPGDHVPLSYIEKLESEVLALREENSKLKEAAERKSKARGPDKTGPVDMK